MPLSSIRGMHWLATLFGGYCYCAVAWKGLDHTEGSQWRQRLLTACSQAQPKGDRHKALA